ncbi:MAG: aminotransferase class V-fold PLP-dependent enzyme [Emergencia sp.]
MIYLNNAECTMQKPDPAAYAGPADEAEARKMTAGLLGVKRPENVFLTRGGEAAVELALRALIGEGAHVITSPMEQDSTCRVLEALAAERNAEIEFIPADVYGILDCDAMEAMIRPQTCAIVCAHGCSVTGNISDLGRVCTIARRHGLPVISDGCQTAGAAEVSVEELGVDVYCFTAEKKLLGPAGLGGICIRESCRTAFEKGLGETAAKHPELTETLRVGDRSPLHPLEGETLKSFCAGLNFVMEKGDYGISIYPHRLAKRFFESVKSMDGVEVYGNFGTSVRVPTVSISAAGFSPEQIRAHMEKNGIICEAGTEKLGSTRMLEVLGRAGEGLARFSFGYFNTRKEVNQAVLALMDLLGLDDMYLLS